MWGNFLFIIQASTGDFLFFEGSEYLTYEENILFWVSFMIIVALCTIIFLNFVISEASASYENVSSRLEEYIYKDRCSLISEAEQMFPYLLRSEKEFPKYIIEREIDT